MTACLTEQDQSFLMQVASARPSCMLQVAWSSLQVARSSWKFASCQVKFPAGQFAGKLPAQVASIEWNRGPRAQLYMF